MLSRLKNIFWFFQPFKSRRVHIVSDMVGWALDQEAQELQENLSAYGYEVSVGGSSAGIFNQHVFYTAVYLLVEDQHHVSSSNKVSCVYYHGQSDRKELVAQFEQFKKMHHCLEKVQVTNPSFRDFILTSGIDSQKIEVIPIGINLEKFSAQTQESRQKYRQRFEIPEEAFVIGSFQKDGQGWNGGDQPKWIKGPDVFLKVLEALKEQIPNLFVLLTGPSRGFVKQGLTRLGIPFRHNFLKDDADMNHYYQVLDLYLVTSREEGGPKSILESMATGVPIISTKVGQAPTVIEHEVNGILVDVEDTDAMVTCAKKIAEDLSLKDRLVSQAKLTVQNYKSQDLAKLFCKKMLGGA